MPSKRLSKSSPVFTFYPALVADTLTSCHDHSQLVRVVKTSIASKQNGYEDLLADLVVKAALEIMPKNPKNFNVDSVRIVKILGASIHDSTVVKGMVFGREPESVVQKAVKAKVAIFSSGIDVAITETKGTVLIKNADELLNFSKGEEKSLEASVKELADAGINVVVSGSSIGELALHFLNRYDILVVKILSKFDLRRLARVVGAVPLSRFGVPTAEEMGYCDCVEAIELGSDRCTVFRQEGESTRTSTIVLRGATQNSLDDLERAIDDGVNSIKALTRDQRLIAGAGAFETELARLLHAVGESTPGLNQYAIQKFAEALEVVPRTLAENAGLDSTEVLSNLYAQHTKGNVFVGVDIESDKNGTLDSKAREIFDILNVKESAIKQATHAAVTLLSVDQV